MCTLPVAELERFNTSSFQSGRTTAMDPDPSGQVTSFLHLTHQSVAELRHFSHQARPPDTNQDMVFQGNVGRKGSLVISMVSRTLQQLSQVTMPVAAVVFTNFFLPR